MRHTTLFPHELRDLMIGLVALALALLIWTVLFVPIAV
jgi:hypothetical protein